MMPRLIKRNTPPDILEFFTSRPGKGDVKRFNCSKNSFEEVIAHLNAGQRASIYLYANEVTDFTLSPKTLQQDVPVLAEVRFGNGVPVCNLVGLSIYECHVDDDAQGPIRIRNCRIGSLIIDKNALVSIEMQNTWIDRLYLASGSCRALDIRAGGILNISVPVSKEAAPFHQVHIARDVFLPSSTAKYPGSARIFPIGGAQPMRNFRRHLLGIENHLLADRIRLLEESLQREDDTVVNRLLSRLYEITSAYSTATLRPFLLAIVTILVAVFVTAELDGGALAELPAGLERSWYSDLQSDSTSARYYRSAVLVLQSVGNPLSILGHRQIVLPLHAWTNLFLAFTTIVVLLFVAFGVLAIRKRFRIGATK